MAHCFSSVSGVWSSNALLSDDLVIGGFLVGVHSAMPPSYKIAWHFARLVIVISPPSVSVSSMLR